MQYTFAFNSVMHILNTNNEHIDIIKKMIINKHGLKNVNINIVYNNDVIDNITDYDLIYTIVLTQKIIKFIFNKVHNNNNNIYEYNNNEPSFYSITLFGHRSFGFLRSCITQFHEFNVNINIYGISLNINDNEIISDYLHNDTIVDVKFTNNNIITLVDMQLLDGEIIIQEF